MNEKLKKIVAAIALILISIFTISFIIYLFDKTLLNGAIGDIAMWSGGFGLLLFIVLWLSHAFPSQKVKDEERERIYKEAEEAEKRANETMTYDEKTEGENEKEISEQPQVKMQKKDE